MTRVLTSAGKSYSTSPSSTMRKFHQLTLAFSSAILGSSFSSLYRHSANPIASATVTVRLLSRRSSISKGGAEENGA
jgi:hypothetical protein